jgi:hypothetical protein
VQATPSKAPTDARYAPRWIWWTLLLGAIVLVAWALFLLSFMSEPSAVGRSRAVLGGVAGFALGAAGFTVVAALGLLRRATWAPRLALVASVFMILSLAGAIVGIPVVFGLLAGRDSKLS